MQLGILGMGALDTVIDFWEDASAVHYSAQHSEFDDEVQKLLQMAYTLQEQSRLIFCDETQDGYLSKSASESLSLRSSCDSTYSHTSEMYE
ncbi:mitoguardin [Drosophila madeirensis]